MINLCSIVKFCFLGSDSHLYVSHLADNRITIQSAANHFYLTFEKGRFVGATPDGSNNVFETVSIGPHIFALRLIDQEEDGADSDCYLGFSAAQSEPRCYDSTEYAATRLTILYVYIICVYREEQVCRSICSIRKCKLHPRIYTAMLLRTRARARAEIARSRADGRACAYSYSIINTRVSFAHVIHLPMRMRALVMRSCMVNFIPKNCPSDRTAG